MGDLTNRSLQNLMKQGLMKRDEYDLMKVQPTGCWVAA